VVQLPEVCEAGLAWQPSAVDAASLGGYHVATVGQLDPGMALMVPGAAGGVVRLGGAGVAGNWALTVVVEVEGDAVARVQRGLQVGEGDAAGLEELGAWGQTCAWWQGAWGVRAEGDVELEWGVARSGWRGPGRKLEWGVARSGWRGPGRMGVRLGATGGLRLHGGEGFADTGG